MYKSLEYNSPTVKVWTTHTKGFIIKNWVDPDTNKIMEERLPYNQPQHYLNNLNNYFKYKLC